jgi:NADPH2:quinone reductase
VAKRIIVERLGGPDVLRSESFDPEPPGSGEIQIRQTAIGLNFIDVYHRTGLYSGPQCPFTLGLEAAGVVEALGEGVSDFELGERVAYASPPMGAYASIRNYPARAAVSVPDGIDDETAAAMMLKGMTAEYLLRRTHRVHSGETLLVHAAAGGVGLIACQWAKHLGARVFGTVGSRAKAELARAHGCDEPILYQEEDVAVRVKELTDGKGVDVVYDSVGRATFEQSLDCLRPRGLLVLFGQSSGKVAPVDLGILNTKGSLFVTRPSLMAYTRTRDELVGSARSLFDVVKVGAVRVHIGQRFPFDRAVEAHRALEARQTTGSTVLTL